jgi:hypothetical protein
MSTLPNLPHRPAAETFATASLETPPPIRLLLFRRIGGRQYDVSCDPSGGNLPQAFQGRGWLFVRRVDLLAGEVRVAFDATAVAAAVAEDGHALSGSLHDVD